MTAAQRTLLARLQNGCFVVRGPFQSWSVGYGIDPVKCAASTVDALERQGLIRIIGGWVPVATYRLVAQGGD